MRNIAKFEIRGNISKITSTDKVTFLNVAVNSYRKGKDGEYEETVEYFDVTCWNKNKEWADNRVVGDFVQIEGHLKPTKREIDGNDVYGITLAVDTRAVLSSKKTSD